MPGTTKLMTTALVALLLAASGGLAEEEAKSKAPPRVEVVFVLDTTGSMGGLIEGAKVKIWKIVNQIVSGKPVPDVRVGLVAYRDRGDSYVTQLTPLTDDLDKVYGVLRGFSASGGGDGPESVNEALHIGLTKPAWTMDERTLRLIYLVGDAPPHMDYQNDVKYPVTCEAAARAGVIINTVQCGTLPATAKIWKDIAAKSEGRYARIDQSGGMVTVKTPYDARLAELSTKLSGTTVLYGSAESREAMRRDRAEADAGLAEAPAEAKAERAGYLAKSGKMGRADLLTMLERGDVKLEDLKEENLPKDLAAMSPEKRKEHIDKLLAERKKLKAELIELDKKRAAYVEEEREKQGKKGDAFDDSVLETLREQAKKVGVTYE